MGPNLQKKQRCFGKKTRGKHGPDLSNMRPMPGQGRKDTLSSDDMKLLFQLQALKFPFQI